MKKMIFTLVAFFAFAVVNGQLKNTKWTGRIHSDNPIEVIFDFRADTTEVIASSDGSSLETLTYAVKDSIIVMKKVFGHSNCETGAEGDYKFWIKDDALYFIIISDPCNNRADALNNSKWDKVKPQ